MQEGIENLHMEQTVEKDQKNLIRKLRKKLLRTISLKKKNLLRTSQGTMILSS